MNNTMKAIDNIFAFRHRPIIKIDRLHGRESWFITTLDGNGQEKMFTCDNIPKLIGLLECLHRKSISKKHTLQKNIDALEREQFNYYVDLLVKRETLKLR